MCKDCTGIKILKGEKGDTGAAGAAGTNGTNGTDGAPGGWSSKWLFDNTVTATPASTYLRFNNANLDVANKIYINKVNITNLLSLSDFLFSFENNIGGTKYYGLLKVYRAASPDTDFWIGEITNLTTVGNVFHLNVTMFQREGGFNQDDEIVIDFTPKGATGATGATPTPAYKVYSALLTQSGTSNPVATVLENTIGSLVWTRTAVGYYRATLSSAFTANKTMVLLGSNSPEFSVGAYNPTANYVLLKTTDATGTFVDDALFQCSVEIRVYN